MTSLDDLLADELRGATPLLHDALEYFLALPDHLLWTETRAGTQRLIERFPAMGTFQNLGRIIQRSARPRELRRSLQELAEGLENHTARITAQGGEALEKGVRIVTISYSSLVEAVILAGHQLGKVRRVLCLRSGPHNEGQLLAGALEQAGVRSLIIEDGAIASGIRAADRVLVGCDLMSPSFFINKTGSAPLTAAAGKAGVPVWVVGDTTRLVPDYDPHSSLPPGFERVAYQDGIWIVCERGLLRPAELAALVKGNLARL